jgi:hypothetical protein
MKKLKTGIFQAISSTVVGLILTALISYSSKEGWIPSYSLLLFSIFNIMANILTINKMRRWGIFYTLGWLIASFIFNAMGLLESVDLVFNIVVPFVILFARFVLWIRGLSRKIHRSVAR